MATAEWRAVYVRAVCRIDVAPLSPCVASKPGAPLHPLGRIGTGDEVSNLIVWFCSPKGIFVTGAQVPVDGGYTAQ